ncbi:hypothetical protein HWV62_14442 [Athelia sp. TMB]|nr:hypothetical protein HWV62_14442 [Athelia sp. TMB]
MNHDDPYPCLPSVLLPSSPHCLCEDRFSLTVHNTLIVPAWSLIQTVLNELPQSPAELIAQIETLSVAFHGSTIPNTSFLARFICNSWDGMRFLTKTWPACIHIALEMPALFPAGVLRPLTHDAPVRQYSKRQIACLVVHQCLCTLSRPSWMQHDGSPDFRIWYADTQPHPKAVHAYLYALFTYFDRIAQSSPSTECLISLTLHHKSALPPISSATCFVPFDLVEVAEVSTSPALLGLPSGACVISANKHIGFGRTGSQEETQVGATPEASAVVLMVPPLGDSDVLVVRGVESMIEMHGYGRKAAMTGIVQEGVWQWGRRTMLFMDALELDAYDTRDGAFVPDLLPGNVERELTKAYTAFASAEYTEVVTGLWGCGAFGGNAEIKTIIQWCAASAAGVPLKFVCELTKNQFLAALKQFIERAEARKWPVSAVLAVVIAIGPGDMAARSVFEHVASILS